MRRGEIYYIYPRRHVGSEMAKGRPAVIVSADWLNATSPVVEVVFLTTRPKNGQLTHVTIHATGCESQRSASRSTRATNSASGDTAAPAPPRRWRRSTPRC